MTRIRVSCDISVHGWARPSCVDLPLAEGMEMIDATLLRSFSVCEPVDTDVACSNPAIIGALKRWYCIGAVRRYAARQMQRQTTTLDSPETDAAAREGCQTDFGDVQKQAAGVSASHEPQNCRARNNWQGVLNRTLEPYLGQNMMAAGGFFSYSYQGIAVEKDLLDLFMWMITRRHGFCTTAYIPLDDRPHSAESYAATLTCGRRAIGHILNVREE
ncbi:hypothetical protein KC367_g17 [Hortaea werneckii]|nr:hypothetical protein KC367_g17 [Hortaea werneckii]